MPEKEYIEREAVNNVLDELMINDSLYNALQDIPAADVVPVVRCKDCKYYRNRPNGLCYAHTEPYGNGYKGDAICVDDDNFCCFSERKEE